MNDTYKPLSEEPRSLPNVPKQTEAGRTLLVGVLGGLASAAGYIIFSRLPEEQKDRLKAQARTAVESRLSDIRSNFNI